MEMQPISTTTKKCSREYEIGLSKYPYSEPYSHDYINIMKYT